ncbi:unnamed protein product [Rhizoctonia solani]|uniref:HAD-like protein n=1 Tax=Rhizoctonia solani TaxID=456999 RepID=A0A8H3E072_9AGAM|nr:unnamed protein product [Rhizoctonia solani]
MPTLTAKALLFDMASRGTLPPYPALTHRSFRTACLGNVQGTVPLSRRTYHLEKWVNIHLISLTNNLRQPLTVRLARSSNVVIHVSPGVRSIDNLRRWVFPAGTPEPILQAEADKFEVEIVNSANRAREQGKHGIIYLPGTKDIMAVCHSSGGKWAICTSATRTYASAALQTVELPLPEAFVTAEDVSKGKPWPEPYLLGAAKCGVDPSECVVFEDAPSGIRSGKAAGSKVIGLLTSHTREAIEAAEPDVIVTNLSEVSATWDGEKFTLVTA